MRLLVAATVAASLFASNLMAAEAVAPLPAGKPAGVKNAQDANDATMWWVLGGAAVVAIVVVSTDNGSNKTTSSATTTS